MLLRQVLSFAHEHMRKHLLQNGCLSFGVKLCVIIILVPRIEKTLQRDMRQMVCVCKEIIMEINYLCKI